MNSTLPPGTYTCTATQTYTANSGAQKIRQNEASGALAIGMLLLLLFYNCMLITANCLQITDTDTVVFLTLETSFYASDSSNLTL